MTSPRRSSRPQSRRPAQIRMRSSKIALAALAGLAILQSRDALAVDRQWIGLGDANWNDSGNWLLGNVPGDGDIADIVNSDAFVRTVEYNYNGTAITLASLLLSNTGAGSTTFVINGNALTTMNATIGGGGNATVNQGGGTFAVNNNFSFVKGSYNLSGGQFSVGSQDYIGDNGTATFTQTGGTHVATNSFAIGIGSTGNGTYNLQAGTLNTNDEDIGTSGARGTLNQSGGDHNANALRVGAIGFGGIGIVNLSGGTLNAPTVLLGSSGNTATGVGILNVTGGTLTASTGITIYNTSIGTNASGITINGGTITTPFIKTSDWSRLNFTGGTLNLSGGVSSNTGTLTISGSANPILNLSGGSIYADTEFIGINPGSSGVFNQTGGSNTAGTLILANRVASTGTYTLSGGTLTAPSLYIGGGTSTSGGGANFYVNGGVLSATNITVWITASRLTLNGGTVTTASLTTTPDWSSLIFNGGTLNLTGGVSANGGTLTIAGSANPTLKLSAGLICGSYEYIGNNSGSTGVFNQTGGTNSAGALRLGNNSGSIGTYNLGDSATLSVATSEYVGYGGTGVFNQTGGRNSGTNGFVFLGYNPGSSGTYNLSDSATLSIYGLEFVGYSGTGVFNQTGGTNFGGVILGENAGSSGTYNLSGSATLGRVGGGGGVTVGYGGTGVFNQTGGTNFSQDLRLGHNVGSTGTYNLSDSATLSVNGAEFIGGYGSSFCTDCGGTNTTGAGVFNQTGGSNTSRLLLVGGNSGGLGTYNLSNSGALSVSDTEYVNGSAVFNQTGGSNTTLGLYVFGYAGGIGTYNMSNSATLLVGGTETIGYNINSNSVSNETGVLNQTGGSNTTGTLILANRVGAIGNYNLAGGTLTAPSVYIGGGASASGGTGNLNVNGGVLTATNITVWNNFSSLKINGGTVTTASLTTTPDWSRLNFISGTLNLTGGVSSNSGTLVIGGGTAIAILNLSGGTIAATSAINNGVFNQTGGISSLGAFSGTGNLIVGGAGTAFASADSLVQSNVTVTTGGTLNIGPATGLVSPVTISNALTITNNANVTLLPTFTASTASGVKTNFVKTLNIGTNGLLDLQNHFISVDNNATPLAKVKQYIDAAYNRNAGTGMGDYNGRGGITSTVVKNNADFMGVGYYNGALQDPANPDNIGQILGPSSNSGAGTKMPLTQILVRPTLTGDLNGDGVVNSYDVTLFNSFGLFNQSTTLGYQAGDLNGDGIVNAKDITIFNSAGNFNSGSYLAAKAAKAATTLTGHSASPSSTVLSPDGGVLGFTYDFGTGGLKVNYHGFTGFAGKPLFNSTNHALSLIDIISTGGAFALDPTKISTAASMALSSPTITGNTEINLTAVNGYLPDGTDLGPILAPGLDLTQLANALTLTFNYTGSRSTAGGVAGLIPITPEPTTLSLIGFGALGLLSRRRVRSARH